MAMSLDLSRECMARKRRKGSDHVKRKKRRQFPVGFLDQNVGPRQSIIRSVNYTVPRYSRLSPGVHTQIPVSDKVYE